MSTDRWQEVDALVDGALALSGPERARFVVDECEGDPELLVQVLDLLLAADEADAILTPALTPTATEKVDSVEPSAPAGFGAFEMIRELGRGGMGTVYLADQHEPVRRQVALKLSAAALPGHEDRLRLEAERQALARLSHPNVAQLFEAGTTDAGHPYFAMEYVDGEPITAYCDRRRLPRRERIELFQQVCAGVEHAHQKGVLHRDLKPSNVLVTEVQGCPVPKIIDFGIAKALDKPLVDATLLTGERIVGTPAYLSPEAVLSGPVDTRADVYSLGVLLQELLIGERPFTRGEKISLVELLRRVAQDDPEPPSRRWREFSDDTRDAVAHSRNADPRSYGRDLRGDLDWIIARALARDPEARYAGVGELAADLRRHLRDEPVLAGPPTTGYRLRKLMRRRKGPILAAALLLLALVGGFVARSLEATRANREAARATERAEAARAAAAEAREAQDETEQVVDFLVGLFAEADPGRTLGEEPTARELLEKASADLLAQDLDASPRVQARILATVAEVERKLGDLQTGLKLATQALELRIQELGEDDPLTARAFKRVGLMKVFLGRHGEAKEHLEKALKVQQRALEDEDRRDEETRKEDRRQLANTMQLLGIVESSQGRQRQALEYWLPELDLREEVFGKSDPVLTFTLQNLAIAYSRLGELSKSQDALRRALTLHEATKSDEHPDVSSQRQILAITLMSQGKWQEARDLLEKALASQFEVLGPDHESYGSTLTIMGALLVSMGEWQEAEEALVRAGDIARNALGDNHYRHANIATHRGWSRFGQGRFAEAESLFRESLDIRIKALGPENPFVAESRLALASTLRLQDRPSEAEAELRAAEEILTGSEGEIPWLLPQLQAERGWVHLGRDEIDTAEKLLQAAFEGTEGEAVRELGPPRGLAARGLAEVASRRGDAEAETKWLDEAGTVFAASLPANHVYRQELTATGGK